MAAEENCSEVEQKVEAQVVEKRYSWSARLAVLLLVVVLAWLGVMVYQVWSFHRKADLVMQQLGMITSTVEANQSQIAHLATLALPIKANAKIKQAISLIQLAESKLYLDQNARAANNLLNLASQHLSDVDDSHWQAVRKLVLAEMDALNQMPKVDVSHIYAQLQLLDKSIEQLPLIAAPVKTVKAAKLEPAEKTQGPFWKRALQASWQSIRDVLVVRRHDDMVQPILTEGQRQQVLLQLHILFAQAQWAAMRHQNDAYQASLQELSAWVSRYFRVADSKTQQTLQLLKQLQGQSVAFVVPNTDELLKAISVQGTKNHG